MKEIVIKIPDYLHERICKVKDFVNESYYMSQLDRADMYKAIKNGTELPKGHNKLIAEPAEEEIAKTIGGDNEFADCIREAVKAVFNNANAVIEADKGEPE